jgi:hypothetical protein
MSISSDVEICNMTLSHLGNYGTVENIETPTTDFEIVFSLWYTTALETFLKMTMPNFSLARKSVAVVDETVPSPFTYAFEYPDDCLKVLGIGNIEDKLNDYTVEADRIYTNIEYADGMPIRYIKKITDVTAMSPEFIIGFSWFLASLVVLPITQDLSKMQLIEKLLPSKMSALSGLNAQENRPIRISRSRFRQSRVTGLPDDQNKR